MEVIVPDILADARQLSAVLLFTGLAVGGVLWLAGWWSHRFWLVLGFTVMGGIWGLQNAAAVFTQPLVAAIGVGLAAGILALTLVRLGAFVAGGYAGLLLIHSAFPAWDQPFLSFLGGGFLAFLLLRYWTMALTSLAGIVLMGHCGLALLDRLGKLDAVAWTNTNHTMITTTCGLMALGGFVVQVLADWLRRAREEERKGAKKEAKILKPNPVALLSAFRRAG